MPIEIKELHIRVAVNTSPGGRPAEEKTPTGSVGTYIGDEAKEGLIAECVETVLQILQNKMER